MIFKKQKHNILVLGCDGMLGYDVYNAFLSRSIQHDSSIGTVIGLSKKHGVKLHEQYALCAFLSKSIHFDYCINCVAFTDTKASETEVAGKTLSYQLNALAPKYIAEACNLCHTTLIHISTDYVFSELSAEASSNSSFRRLFRPTDEPFPVNTYGKDKLLGELGIIEAYGKKSDGFAILRTSWLYGMHNSKSFIHKFLKNAICTLKASKTSSVSMTENERSVPTSTDYLVDCILSTIRNKAFGRILHAVPIVIENGGVTRLQFAQAILDNLNLPENASNNRLSEIKLDPVSNYNGHQPKFSALDSSFDFFTWEQDLRRFLHKNNNEMSAFVNSL